MRYPFIVSAFLQVAMIGRMLSTADLIRSGVCWPLSALMMFVRLP
jgi:hypothetical protein